MFWLLHIEVGVGVTGVRVVGMNEGASGLSMGWGLFWRKCWILFSMALAVSWIVEISVSVRG